MLVSEFIGIISVSRHEFHGPPPCLRVFYLSELLAVVFSVHVHVVVVVVVVVVSI